MKLFNSPMAAKTERQHLRLRTDNTETEKYWFLINEEEVTICEQKNGEVATNSIKIPKADFNKIVRWYIKPQKPKRVKQNKKRKPLKK